MKHHVTTQLSLHLPPKIGIITWHVLYNHNDQNCGFADIFSSSSFIVICESSFMTTCAFYWTCEICIVQLPIPFTVWAWRILNKILICKIIRWFVLIVVVLWWASLQIWKHQRGLLLKLQRVMVPQGNSKSSLSRTCYVGKYWKIWIV